MQVPQMTVLTGLNLGNQTNSTRRVLFPFNPQTVHFNDDFCFINVNAIANTRLTG
jgi:hypothetical protein